jgi:hypothetical protein
MTGSRHALLVVADWGALVGCTVRLPRQALMRLFGCKHSSYGVERICELSSGGPPGGCHSRPSGLAVGDHTLHQQRRRGGHRAAAAAPTLTTSAPGLATVQVVDGGTEQLDCWMQLNVATCLHSVSLLADCQSCQGEASGLRHCDGAPVTAAGLQEDGSWSRLSSATVIDREGLRLGRLPLSCCA